MENLKTAVFKALMNEHNETNKYGKEWRESIGTDSEETFRNLYEEHKEKANVLEAIVKSCGLVMEYNVFQKCESGYFRKVAEELEARKKRA